MESFKERRERIKKEQDEIKRIKDLKTKFKRRVRSDITSSGIQSVKYKLDYIRGHPSSISDELSYELIIECYNEAIEQFLKLKK